MTPFRCLLGAALVSSAAFAADSAPLKSDIYIRGAFNGWGTDNVLAYKGKGVYEADIQVSPGNHAFKVGSRDWSTFSAAGGVEGPSNQFDIYGVRIVRVK